MIGPEFLPFQWFYILNISMVPEFPTKRSCVLGQASGDLYTLETLLALTSTFRLSGKLTHLISWLILLISWLILLISWPI